MYSISMGSKYNTQNNITIHVIVILLCPVCVHNISYPGWMTVNIICTQNLRRIYNFANDVYFTITWILEI